MLQVSAASDRGRMRERNEDEYCVYELPGGSLLLAVADGMGGHQAGDVASRLAIATLEAAVEEGFGPRPATVDHEELLRRSVEAANRRVLEQSRSDVHFRGMGTTLTAVLYVPGHPLSWVHVGDTRLYRHLDGRLEQVTEDHSLAQELVRSGEISSEEAEHHAQRHILTRALGTEASVEIDTGRLALRPGERLLLVSDGLTAVVSGPELAGLLDKTTGVEGLAERLVRIANERGGPDNITVIAASLESEGEGA